MSSDEVAEKCVAEQDVVTQEAPVWERSTAKWIAVWVWGIVRTTFYIAATVVVCTPLALSISAGIITILAAFAILICGVVLSLLLALSVAIIGLAIGILPSFCAFFGYLAAMPEGTLESLKKKWRERT